jgi:hypothetical protein
MPLTNTTQHIGFCLELLQIIAPAHVLDLSDKPGRWGLLLQEFASTWLADGTRISIEGLATGETLDDCHRASYTKLHDTAPAELLATPDVHFDAAIFDNPLLQFSRQELDELLLQAQQVCDYAIIATPLSDVGITANDFQGTSLVAKRLFQDAEGNACAVFVLSITDEKHLADQITSPSVVSPDLLKDLARFEHELQAISSSPVWRTWTSFRHSELGRNSAKIMRTARALLGKPYAQTHNAGGADAQQVTEGFRKLGNLTSDDWLALHNPEWAGVSASTRMLFDHPLPLQHVVTPQVTSVAHALLDSGVRKFVLSGLGDGWLELAVEIKRQAPESRISCLWHSSLTYMTPGPLAEQVFGIVDLAQRGILNKIGFIKEGLAEIFARTGVRTEFIMNYLRAPAGTRTTPIPDGQTHIGLFFARMDFGKNIFTQLAAAAMIPKALVHLVPADPALERLAQELRLPYMAAARTRLPHDQMMALMAQMHVNLNVTLSECCPMIVLESLSLGVPCPMSATSHLFRDNDYLHSRLCVQYHDNPSEIAKFIAQARDERTEIIKAYDAYIPGYNERAQESVERFLAF